MVKKGKINYWAAVRFIEDKKLYIADISEISVGKKNSKFNPKTLDDYSKRSTYWVLYNDTSDLIYSGNFYECQILKLFTSKTDAETYISTYKSSDSTKRVIVPPARLEDDGSLDVDKTMNIMEKTADAKFEKKEKIKAVKASKEKLNKAIVKSLEKKTKNVIDNSGDLLSKEEDLKKQLELKYVEIGTLEETLRGTTQANEMLQSKIILLQDKYAKSLEEMKEVYEKCANIVGYFTGVLGAVEQEKERDKGVLTTEEELKKHKAVFEQTFEAYGSLNKKLSSSKGSGYPPSINLNRKKRLVVESSEEEEEEIKKLKIEEITESKNLVPKSTPISESSFIPANKTNFDKSASENIKVDNISGAQKADSLMETKTSGTENLSHLSRKKSDDSERSMKYDPDVKMNAEDYDSSNEFNIHTDPQEHSDDEVNIFKPEEVAKDVAANETVCPEESNNIFDIETPETLECTSNADEATSKPTPGNPRKKKRETGKRKESIIYDAFYPTDGDNKSFPKLLTKNDEGKVHIGYNNYITSSQWEVLKNKASTGGEDADRSFVGGITTMLWGDKICRRSLTGTGSPKFAADNKMKPKKQATPAKVKATAGLLKMKWKKEGKSEDYCKKNLLKTVASVYGPRSSECKKKTLRRIKLGKAIEFMPDSDDDLQDFKILVPEKPIIFPTST